MLHDIIIFSTVVSHDNLLYAILIEIIDIYRKCKRYKIINLKNGFAPTSFANADYIIFLSLI